MSQQKDYILNLTPSKQYCINAAPIRNRYKATGPKIAIF